MQPIKQYDIVRLKQDINRPGKGLITTQSNVVVLFIEGPKATICREGNYRDSDIVNLSILKPLKSGK
jgi:hypothetical protein